MSETPGVPREHDHVTWFRQHYDEAADQVVEFLAGDGLTLDGKVVADVGCGDGVIDLGLVHRTDPIQLTGYDLRPTDVEAMNRAAVAAGVQTSDGSPALSFMTSDVTAIPAPDATFDVVFSWSVFEHVDDPVALLTEVRRILKPDGVFFLQLWPFYYSEHGGHLWMNYEEPFPHLTHSDREIEAHLKLRPATDPTRPADDEYRSLNRLTLDGLQRALIASRLTVTKLELLTGPLHVPTAGLMQYSLSDLGIGGVKLLASPV